MLCNKASGFYNNSQWYEKILLLGGIGKYINCEENEFQLLQLTLDLNESEVCIVEVQNTINLHAKFIFIIIN